MTGAELSFTKLTDAATTIEGNADQDEKRHGDGEDHQERLHLAKEVSAGVAIPHVLNQPGQDQDIGEEVADGHFQHKHPRGAGLELLEVDEEDEEIAADANDNQHDQKDNHWK